MQALLAPLTEAGWRRYAVAVLAVALTAGVRLLLGPWVGERLPFVTLFFAIFVAAWYGGFGPTLLATALGALVSLYIFLGALSRVPGMNRVAAIGYLFFILTGIATGWLGETRLRAMRRAKQAAVQAAAEADRADEERARAEDEAAKAEEAAAEAELAAQDAAESLERQLGAEAALRDSEQELADLFENATVGLSWIAPDGTILRANRAQLAMLGLPAADYVGRPFADVVAEPGAAADLLHRLAAGEVVHEVPGTLRTPTGEVREVVVSSSPYLTHGRLSHTRCFVRDVTDHKRAEAAVRSLQRLESVGRLAGGMAHEVNNQMTIVLGAADFILRRSDVPAPARADVQFMRDAAERSAGIAAQLLAFGRRQILRAEVLDLNAVLEAFGPVLERTLGLRYRVALDLAPRGTRARVDRGQLEQVLLNLALNAADAMAGGGMLTLSTRGVELAAADRRVKMNPDVRPGSYVELAVRDTGAGMDGATLERVFEPFFTTKPVGKGTGLGLSTVYGIVRQSGGYVAATSLPGHGSEFAIYLPASAEPADTAAAEAPASHAPGRGETVLVVEDAAEVRQMAARALQDGGYAVLQAGDGVEALAMLQNGHPGVRLVLTDLALPNLDGLALARELGRTRPGVAVLFMTGYTGDEAVRGALPLDHPLIEKPFTAELLVRRVRQALDSVSPPSPA